VSGENSAGSSPGGPTPNSSESLRREDPFAVDRRAVARSFGAASAEYDTAALLQRDVRNELLARLDELRLQPDAVLDLGAGTGEGSRALKDRFPKATVIAADLAPAMLAEAGKRRGLWRRFQRVAADAYRLPFQSGAFDVVFSSLMFQWCDNLAPCMAEVQRVLKPGGRLLFTTFGPDTLIELREAWGAADPGVTHVNRFLDIHDVGSAVMQAGLAEPVLDVDRIVRHYPDPQALMRELKTLGAHNVTAGRSRGLTGPGRLRTMLAAYETLRQDGTVPATYEVIYASAWGTEPRRSRSALEGEVHISPSAIRRRP
jgi:malonyl-CoA O-methyltransferase